MKLKVVFIIFNIILILLVVTMLFIPLIYGESPFTMEFLKMSRFCVPVFLALILAVDIFFFKNKVLISAIEVQDWAALVKELEVRIYTKRRITYKNTRLLTDTLLLLGDFSSINKLSSFLKENKPKYLSKLALKFAASKMIASDYAALFEFASEMKLEDTEKGEWLTFYSAIALQMLREYDKSAVLFDNISGTAKNPLVKCLSSYFVVEVLKNYSKLTTEDIEKKKLFLCSKIKKDYTRASWKQYTESEKKEIHIMILTKIIDDVNLWLFS